MSGGITRKDLKRDEFVEATIEASHWLERHWRALAGAAVILAVAVLGVAGWSWNSERQRVRIGELLDEATTLYRRAEGAGFSRPELEQALAKLDQAAGISNRGDAARLVAYWRGSALFRLDRPDDAAGTLERVVSDPASSARLRGAAQALLAAVHQRAGKSDRAEEILRGLASAEPEIYPADQALVELAQLYERRGDAVQARATWQSVVDRFPGRPSAATAREHLGP